MIKSALKKLYIYGTKTNLYLLFDEGAVNIVEAELILYKNRYIPNFTNEEDVYPTDSIDWETRILQYLTSIE